MSTGDSCNAVERVASKMFICSEPLGHRTDHRDGDFTWRSDQVRETPKVLGQRGQET